MGTNQDNKNIFSFKTRKDQIYTVVSIPVLLFIIGYIVKFANLLWKVFFVVGSFATTNQLTESEKSIRAYCDTAISKEQADRKEQINDIKTDYKDDLREIRRKCLRGYGDK